MGPIPGGAGDEGPAFYDPGERLLSRYSLDRMADDQRHVLAATGDSEQAVEAPTVIDADELAKARLDERWREFCLNAEQYVAETTRPTSTRVRQPA